MARRVNPGGFLPRTQALPGIGDRIAGLQALLGGVEQMHAPGVGVTVLLRDQEIAIGRLGADAGQNRLSAVEKLIVQPGARDRSWPRLISPARLSTNSRRCSAIVLRRLCCSRRDRAEIGRVSVCRLAY
jgi:hypothetical protein